MPTVQFNKLPTDEQIEGLREKGYEYLPDIGEYGGARSFDQGLDPVSEEVEQVAEEEQFDDPEPYKPEPDVPVETAPEPKRYRFTTKPTAKQQKEFLSRGIVYDETTGVATQLEPHARLKTAPTKEQITKLAAKGYSFSDKDNLVYKIGVGRVPIEKDMRIGRESAQKFIWLSGREKSKDIEPSVIEEFEASVKGVAGSLMPRAKRLLYAGTGLPTPREDAEIQEAARSAYAPLKRRRFQTWSVLDADEEFWENQRKKGNQWSDIEVNKESLSAAAQRFRDAHARKFKDAQANLQEYEGMTRVGKTAAALVGEGAFLGQPEAVAETTGATQLLKEANSDLQMARYLENLAKNADNLPEQSDFNFESFRKNLGKGIDFESEQTAHKIASEAQNHSRGLAGDPGDMEWEQINDALFSVNTVNNAIGAVVDGLVFLPVAFKNVLVDPMVSGAKYGYASITSDEQEEIDRLYQEYEDESFEVFEGAAYAGQGLVHMVGEGAGGLTTLATGTPEQKEKTAKRMVYGVHKYLGDIMTATGGIAGIGRARAATRVATLNKELAEKTQLLDELIQSAPEGSVGRAVAPTAKGVVSDLTPDNVPFGTFNRATREAQTPSGKVVIPNMDRLPAQSQLQVQALVDEIAALGLRRRLAKESHDKLLAYESVVDPTYAVLRAYGALPGLLTKYTQFEGGNMMRTMFRRRSDVLDEIKIDNVTSTVFRDMDGNGYSVSDMLFERRPELAQKLIAYRDTAERIPDELLSEVEDMVTEFAKAEGKQLWFETPDGELLPVHTGVPEFNPQGVFGRELTEVEKADMRARPEAMAKQVSENLGQKSKDVQKVIKDSSIPAKWYGLTEQEAVAARGLIEEADRTALLVKDAMLLQKQATNIKTRVVANVRRRNNAVQANNINGNYLKAEFGKSSQKVERKGLLSKAISIVDEVDQNSKWGTGKDKYNAEGQQIRLKKAQESLKEIAKAKNDKGQFILEQGQRRRVLKAAKDIEKISKAENNIVGTVRSAYKKVPYQAIEGFDAVVARALERQILSLSKQDAGMAQALTQAVDEALNASRKYDAAQEAFDTAKLSRAADADKNVYELVKVRSEAKVAYDEAMAKIEAGLGEAKVRADRLKNDRVSRVEKVAAATTVEEAFKSAGNGSVAKQSALLQAGYIPKAIPAKHIALAKAVKLNQDASLPPGKMNPFAEELDRKLAEAGEDFSVTNNGKGWTEADNAYFDWVNDTFNVDLLPSARAAYIDTPPNGFANEQVLLIASQGIRASDPKTALAMGLGAFKGADARAIAKFKRLKDEGRPIPEELQAQVDAVDFGKAYKKELAKVAKLRKDGMTVPAELQKVHDNVVASLASDMRQKITQATVAGIESGYFTDEMAEAVLTRIADYFPDTYLKTEKVYSSLGERAAATVAKVRGKSSQSLNDYSQRGNHKKRAVNKHLTRAERKEKGLVSDARVAFIRGYNEILNDITNLNFFNRIRDAKVTTGPFKGQKLMMTAEEVKEAGLPTVEIEFGKKAAVLPEIIESMKELRVVLANKGGAKYVKLPNNYRLGEFANKYVPDDVFFEFKRLIESPAESAINYNSALQWFKWGKTAASAATSGRNHIANWTVADLNNMLVGSGSKTAKEVLSKDLITQTWNQSGPLYEEAMISGVLGSDFVTSELSSTFKFSEADIPDFFSVSDNPTLLSTVMTAWEMGRYNEVARLMGDAVEGAPKSLSKAVANAPESVVKGVKGFTRLTTHQYRFGDEMYKVWRYTQIRRLQDEFSKTGTLTREMESALGGRGEALEVLNIDGKYAKMRAAAKKTHRDGFVDYSGSSLAIGWLSKGPQPFARFTGAITPVVKRLLARNAVKSLLYRNTTRQLEEYTMRIDSEKNDYDYEDIEIARSSLGFGSHVNGFFVGQKEYTDSAGQKYKYFGFQNLSPLSAYAGSVLPSDMIANEPTSEIPLAGMLDITGGMPFMKEFMDGMRNRTKYDANFGDLAGYDSDANWLENIGFKIGYYGQDLMPVVLRDLYRAGAVLTGDKFVTPSGRVLFVEDLANEIILLQKPAQATTKSLRLAQERAIRKATAYTYKDRQEVRAEQLQERGEITRGQTKLKMKQQRRDVTLKIREQFRKIEKEAREQAARTRRSAQRKRIGDAREMARDRQRGLEESIRRANREAAE